MDVCVQVCVIIFCIQFSHSIVAIHCCNVCMLFIDACMPERCIGHAAGTKVSISMHMAIGTYRWMDVCVIMFCQQLLQTMFARLASHRSPRCEICFVSAKFAIIVCARFVQSTFATPFCIQLLQLILAIIFCNRFCNHFLQSSMLAISFKHQLLQSM